MGRIFPREYIGKNPPHGSSRRRLGDNPQSGQRNRERLRMQTCLIDSDLTDQIIGAAIEVHKHWGPGLYEEIYERSLCYELQLRGIAFSSQVQLPLLYKGKQVGGDVRLDLLVQSKVVVELKSVDKLAAIHEAQLLTYMKIVQCRVGLLVNFNVPVLKQGIRRMVL